MKAKVAAAGLLVLLSAPVLAVPVTFTYQTTINDNGAVDAPGIVTGDLLTATIVADNGGTDLISQAWFQSSVLSATVTVGASYVATFSPPFYTNDPIFRTNGAGGLLIAAWYDTDGGAGDVDNLGGSGAPKFYDNALVTSINGTQLDYVYPIFWQVQLGGGTVPEPGVLGLIGLGLAGLAATRRRKQ